MIWLAKSDQAQTMVKAFYQISAPLYQIGAFLASIRERPSCLAVSGRFTTTSSDFSRISHVTSSSTLPAK